MSELNAELSDALKRYKKRAAAEARQSGNFGDTQYVKTQNGKNIITFHADAEGQPFIAHKAWLHKGPNFPRLFTALDWDFLAKDQDGGIILDRAVSNNKVTDEDIEKAVTLGDPVRRTIRALIDLGMEGKTLPSPRFQYVTCANNVSVQLNGIFTAPKTVMEPVIALSEGFPIFSGGMACKINRTGTGLGTEYTVIPDPSVEASPVNYEGTSIIGFAASRVRPLNEAGLIAVDVLSSSAVKAAIADEILDKKDVKSIHEMLILEYAAIPAEEEDAG